MAPVITTQPADQTVARGRSASFSVVAAGLPPVTYQWKKNGGNIQGATLATYTIASAQPTDAADYSVLVTAASVSILSSTAHLSLKPSLDLGHSSLSYAAFGPPLPLADGGQVLDAGSTIFTGWHLVIGIEANAQADDQLTVRHQGTASGQIGVAGNQIFYGTSPVATFTGGQGSTPLDIAFTATTCPDSVVQAVLQNLQYSYFPSGAPSQAARTVAFSLVNPSSVTTSTANLEINVTAGTMGFLKGVNLGGAAPVTIDGHAWLTYSQAKASGLSVTPDTSGTRSFTPSPAVDNDTKQMLESFVTSPQVPSGPVSFNYMRFETDAWADRYVQFSSSAELYGFAAGWNRSWCIDHGSPDAPASEIETYQASLYYSYGAPYPAFDRQAINKVNFILNHKDVTGVTSRAIQFAIWKILNPQDDPGSAGFPTSGAEYEAYAGLVYGANAQGAAFVPAENGIGGVILYIPSGTAQRMKQSLIVERPVTPRTLSLAQVVPVSGNYSVMLWLAESEAANVRSLDIRVQGNPAASQVGNLPLNAWGRLGPFAADVTDGSIRVDITSPISMAASQGDPVLMGYAIYGILPSSPNTPPVVSLGPPVDYTIGGGPVLVAPTASITDAESAPDDPGFAAEMRLEVVGNADQDDQLRIQNQGSGATQIGCSASGVITYGVETIGYVVSKGQGRQALVVQLQTSLRKVEALLRAVEFLNPNANPLRLDRTIRVVVRENDAVQDSAPAENTVRFRSTNRGPVVEAGPDLFPVKPTVGSAVAQLSGFVEDDGLPLPSSLVIQWAVVETPDDVSASAVQFGHADSPTTTASFPAVGRYVLRLQATDGGAIQAEDTLAVFVGAEARHPQDIILIGDRTDANYNINDSTFATRSALASIKYISSLGDQVGLVTCSTEPALLQRILTADYNSIQGPVPETFCNHYYGNLKDAITIARLELLGSRHNPNAERVVIIFSNGQTMAPEGAVKAALVAKEAGIRVIVVGAFTHCISESPYPDDQLLAKQFLVSLSSEGDNYFELASAEEPPGPQTTGIFRKLAASLKASDNKLHIDPMPAQVLPWSSGSVSATLVGNASVVTAVGTWAYRSDLSAPGTASLTGTGWTRSVVITPETGSRGGTYVFTFTAVDPSSGNSRVAYASITVTAGTVDDVFVVKQEGGEYTLDVTANDVGRPGLTISELGNSSDLGNSCRSSRSGMVNLGISPDGKSVTYHQPATGSVEFGRGLDTFSYSVVDGNGFTDKATVTVFVDHVNRPPRAQDFLMVKYADGSCTDIDILSHCFDPDWGDSLSPYCDESFFPIEVRTVSPLKCGLGSLSLVPAGGGGSGFKVTYTTPGVGTTGMDEFEYTIADTYGACATGRVQILVTDDLNVQAGASGWRAEDDYANLDASANSITIDVLGNDTGQPAHIYSYQDHPTGQDDVNRSPGDQEQLEYAPAPGARPSAPISFWYKLYGLDRPQATATVHVGFLSGAEPNIQGDISNLEAEPGEGYKTISKGFLELRGTAYDAANTAAFVTYNIEVQAGDGQELLMVSSNGCVQPGGVLSSLDLTGYTNGLYKVLLQVYPLGYSGTLAAEDAHYILLNSDFKLGHLRLSVTDLSVPLGGVPLEFTRTYDSLDTGAGEFGQCWRLSLGAQLTTSGVLGANWRYSTSGGSMCLRNNGQLVTIRLAGQQEMRFLAQVKVAGRFPCYSGLPPVAGGLYFDPLPGTVGTLADTTADLVPNYTGEVVTLTTDGTDVYNPTQFTYTDPSGRQYLFDDGHISSVTDRNGNTLAFTATGVDYTPAGSATASPVLKVLHDSSLSETLITGVISPSEIAQNIPTVVYEYELGMLAHVHLSRVKRLTDKSDPAQPKYSMTQYYYDRIDDLPDHITSITGPSGCVMTEYDAQGRVTSTTDALGAKTSIAYGNKEECVNSAAVARQIVTDALGRAKVSEFNERGDIVLMIDPRGAKTSLDHQYDSHDRKKRMAVTDDLNRTTVTEYGYVGDGSVVRTMTVTQPHTLDPSDPSRDQDSDFQAVSQFNEQGAIVSFTDANQHTTTTDYYTASGVNAVNAVGKIKSTKDASQNETEYLYLDQDTDGYAEIIRQLDPKKNRTDTTVNRFGWVEKVEFFANLGTVATPNYAIAPDTSTVYTYDSNGAVQTERTSRTVNTDATPSTGPVTRTMSRDAAGRIIHTEVSTLREGTTTVVSTDTDYGENGKPRVETRYNQVGPGKVQILTTTYDYNQRGDLILTSFPDGTASGVIYDLAGQVVTNWNVGARATSHEYDAAGRNTKTIFPDGTFTSSEYDSVGQVAATRDRAGLRTSFEYDEAGHRTSITNSAFKVHRYGYDKVGNLTSETNAVSAVTSYTYDAENRRTKIVYADQTYTVSRYDSLGQEYEAIASSGVATGFNYDPLGRLVMVTNAAAIYTMPQGGDPIMSDAAPADRMFTGYVYDEAGNLTDQYDANQHNANGTLKSGAKSTHFEYDSFGKRTSRKLPTGTQIETWHYNDLGQVTEHTDFNQHTTTFEYDLAGRVIKKTPDPYFANSAATEYSYTVTGQRASMRYPVESGVDQVDYHYRGDRLWKKVAPEGIITYGYTGSGKLASLEISHSGTRSGLVSYTYDSQDRLEFVHDDLTVPRKTTRYEYDDPGNLAKVRYPNTIESQFAYDSVNRLRRVRVAAAAGLLANFDYDEAGEGSEPSTTRSAWGARLLSSTGRRNRVTEKYANGTQPILRTVDYGYDKLDRLTQETLSSSSGVRYDGTTPPGGSGADLLPYDKVGNRQSRRSTVAGVASTPANVKFDLNDQIDNDATPTTPSTYFDANGNTLQADRDGDGSISSIEAQYTYEYDSDNRLVRCQFPRPGAAGTRRVTLAYEGDGNRVRKLVQNWGAGQNPDTDASSDSTLTTYLVDAENLTGFAQALEEWKTLNNDPSLLDRSYTYGLDLISQSRNVGTVGTPNWVTHYYGYDGLGSARFLADEGAQITDVYFYDAFGIQIGAKALQSASLVDVALDSSLLTPNSHKFTGEYYDQDLGMYYLHARYYRPELGRFWTMDSFEGSQQDPLSLHKYLYCADNPVNKVDPTGQFGDFISFMAGSLIANSLNATYNGAVTGAGNAGMATIFGVQAGQGANDILTGFIFDETGIGLAIDAYQAVRGLFQDDESKAMAAYMLWQEELIATILASMEDNEFGEIRVELVPQCFLAGTPVATGDGLKPIEEIRPGDNVWAWNEATDELALRPVLNRFVHQRNEVFEILAGRDTFKVTGEHPFYVSGKGWIPSREVEVGDQFVTSDDRALVVDSVAKRSGDFLVYNFEASTDHNYYVGEEGVLTHNMNALRAAMKLKSPSLAAHHIVALRAKGAKVCRDLLLAPGTGIINLNDLRNGVPLPKNLKVRVPGYANARVHSVLHTKKYWTELQNRLAAVAPGQRIQVLSQTANELLLGRFPFK